MTKPDISVADIKKIAALARLGLSEQEIATAQRDLANILASFSQIQTVDTAHTPTSDDVTGKSNITRSDVPQPDILCASKQLLDGAPATFRGHFQVKAVF